MIQIYTTLLEKPYWVFDLDNTLYNADISIFDQMNALMQAYILEHTDIDPEDAHMMRTKYFYEYGNSLTGLQKHHGIDAHDFLEKMHDLDYTDLPICPIITDGIQSLQVQKFVHTNGTLAHAYRVCDKMGITPHLEGIFGIDDSDLIPKPNAKPYHMMWKKYNINPAHMVFFEDMVHNLEYPKTCGATTVFINRNTHADIDIPDFVDITVSDLADIFVDKDCKYD